jgi:hypothetical protein
VITVLRGETNESLPWVTLAGYFKVSSRASELLRLGAGFVALLRGIQHSFPATIVLFDNPIGSFRHFVQGSPALVFDCDGKTPVMGFCATGPTAATP